MIRLRTLGTVGLTDSEDRELRSVLRRPKLLALLAYLGIARPPGFHRRDVLVALLWPELDHAHARNALRQAVHALRRALGGDVVAARGEEELGISAARLSTDVRQFEQACDAGRLDQALDLYRGALLSGLHVSGVPEFERWLEREREHLRRRACDAVRTLVDREEAAGDFAAAARWAHRWAELSPFDETAVRRMIEVLNRGGDRAGAVRAYEEFEQRLQRDLEVGPSAATAALVRDIRVGRHEAGSTASGDEHPAAGRGVQSDAKPVGAVRRAAPRRWRVAALAVVGGSLMATGWVVFNTRFGTSTAAAARSEKRLAVLPLANLGPPEDAYFADGIAAEIAARLAAIDGLRVIGSTSAARYKGTSKRIPEIGLELGVDHILEGSVRFERPAAGAPRVRVTLQLVSAADGAHRWAQVYDEPLDEIFRVQSEIARKVVESLEITLGDAQRRRMEAVPTGNLQAYDYYLRGNEYVRRGTEQRNRLAAIRMYERAVELDPTFALAYAQLSRMHSQMYGLFLDRSAERLAQARRAVDRAFGLQPGLPEAHLALGAYYFNGFLDYDRALREFTIAATRRPSDNYAFLARAIVRTRPGDLEAAFADFERAQRIDPTNPTLAMNYGRAYDLAREFARAESLYDRAIALSPDWGRLYSLKAWLSVRRDGDTRRARSVLDEARTVGVADDPWVYYTRVLVETLDRRYDRAIALLSEGTPDVINDQFTFVPGFQLSALVYALAGRHDLATAYSDSASRFVAAEVARRPDDPRLRSALGIALAGLGRGTEAIAEGRKAVDLTPLRTHADFWHYCALNLARIYAMVGERDAAVGQLEQLLAVPGSVTPALLRLDPAWDPLRDHPRFRRLVARK